MFDQYFYKVLLSFEKMNQNKFLKWKHIWEDYHDWLKTINLSPLEACISHVLHYKEISNIIEKQYQRAIKLLEANKDKLTQLAEVLLEKEVIFKDNLEKIFGKRPFEKEQALNAKEDIKEEEE